VTYLAYADYNATYPTDQSHFETVGRILFQNKVGNPSSLHEFGREAKRLVENSRVSFSKLIGAEVSHVYFFSGATEANNFVVRSLLEASSHSDEFLLFSGEHPSVYKPMKLAEKRLGRIVKTVPMSKNGQIDVQALDELLNPAVKFLSLVYVNNELGSVNQVKDIAHWVKKKYPHVFIHVDAVQALGKLDLSELGCSNIDSASFSAHKAGGLLGCGALYLKKPQSLPVDYGLLGGSQERGLRAGTENLPGIVSMGVLAEELILNPFKLRPSKNLMEKLAEFFHKQPKIHLNIDPLAGVGSVFNLFIKEISADLLNLHFNASGVCLSFGSACSSGQKQPSSVLQALGVSSWGQSHSLRLSFSNKTNQKDIDHIMDAFKLLLS
jgi:cysteine desulfurase